MHYQNLRKKLFLLQIKPKNLIRNLIIAVYFINFAFNCDRLKCASLKSCGCLTRTLLITKLLEIQRFVRVFARQLIRPIPMQEFRYCVSIFSELILEFSTVISLVSKHIPSSLLPASTVVSSGFILFNLRFFLQYLPLVDYLVCLALGLGSKCDKWQHKQ